MKAGVGENSPREKRFWNYFFKKIEKRIFFQILFSKSRKKNLFSNSFFEKLKKRIFFKILFSEKKKRFFFQKSFFKKNWEKKRITKNSFLKFADLKWLVVPGTDHFWSDSSSAESKFFLFICSQSQPDQRYWKIFFRVTKFKMVYFLVRIKFFSKIILTAIWVQSVFLYQSTKPICILKEG